LRDRFCIIPLGVEGNAFLLKQFRTARRADVTGGISGVTAWVLKAFSMVSVYKV